MAPLDSPIGARIGHRYTVEHLLARGGVGTLYVARDETTGTPVAIKLLGQRMLADARFVARFQREAEIASTFSHPNAVRVLDFGSGEHGPFLVMELLEGRTLADALFKAGSVPPSIVLAWATPIAAALDALHAAGLVHRDIKPANLFERDVPASDPRRYQLVDFGLVKWASDQGKITRHGRLVGTPSYIAPEVVSGENSTARSDVYSLATTVFEALTGAVPFVRPHPRDVMRAKVTERAPRLSAAAGFDFGGAVDAVLADALSRDPLERPASASAFVERLAVAAAARVPGRLEATARSIAAEPAAADSAPPTALDAPKARGETPVAERAALERVQLDDSDREPSVELYIDER